MPTRLCKWGNSLGLRISHDIAERAVLEAGDYMYIRLMDSGDIVIRPVKQRETPAGYEVRDRAQSNKLVKPLSDEEVRMKW